MMDSFKIFLVVAATLMSSYAAVQPRTRQSYNILFFTMYGSTSHLVTFLPAMEALLLRGHNVTYLTEEPHLPRNVPNLRVHVMESLHTFLLSTGVNSYNSDMKLNDREFLTMWYIVNFEACRVFLDDPTLRAFVADKSTRYDLVIMDPAVSECGLSLLHLLGHPPFIYYCTTHLYPWIALSMGIPTPISYTPMLSIRSNDLRNLRERIWNAHGYVVYDLFRYDHMTNFLMKRVRSVHPTMPSLLEIEKNVSFVLANSHSPSLDVRRPMTKYFAEVGGTHLRPAKPLSKDLEEFINGSGKHGFIYLSLGTFVSDMSAEKANAFVGAFRKLKQRVVWRSQNLNITGLASNIRFFPWVPQQDLLGHPKIKAFVNQGGQLSIQEAAYHGVPVLGMPFVGDQFVNMQNARERGIAEEINYETLDERTLFNALTKILRNPSYKKNCRRLSALMLDRPATAIDTITYWVEYVARHKGAANLRLKYYQRQDYILQYFSLDVFGAAIVFFVVALVLGVFVLKIMVKALRAIFNATWFRASSSANINKKPL